jgi:quinol-cytochrome oxidoreductase complex cytochrome b subunit
MANIVDRPRMERTSRYYWEREHAPGEKFIPYFWQEFVSQVMVFFFLLGIIGALSLLWPAGVTERANALVTPPGTKPEWYYLGLYQLLKVPHVTDQIGLLIVGVIMVMLVALPFIDRGPERNPLRKPVTSTIAGLLISATIALTIWGAVSK